MFPFYRSKKLTNQINTFENENSIFEHENSKTNEPHRFTLSLVDKLNLKVPNKDMSLANLSMEKH